MFLVLVLVLVGDLRDRQVLALRGAYDSSADPASRWWKGENLKNSSWSSVPSGPSERANPLWSSASAGLGVPHLRGKEQAWQE